MVNLSRLPWGCPNILGDTSPLTQKSSGEERSVGQIWTHRSSGGGSGIPEGLKEPRAIQMTVLVIIPAWAPPRPSLTATEAALHTLRSCRGIPATAEPPKMGLRNAALGFLRHSSMGSEPIIPSCPALAHTTPGPRLDRERMLRAISVGWDWDFQRALQQPAVPARIL